MAPKPTNVASGLTTGGLPEVWEELLPYLVLGWAPAQTSGDNAMCALHALTEALNAHRIINEGLDPAVIHLSFEDICVKFQSGEYEFRAKAIAHEFSKSRANPRGDPQIRDDVLKEYMRETWLNHEQLGVILEMINTDLNLNYRLGVITAGQQNADGTRGRPIAYLYPRPAGGGPVIWLYSYGHFTHWEAIVPDQPLTNRADCDYNQWQFKKRAEELVTNGLYLVTMDMEPVSETSGTAYRRLGLEIGQFVTRQDVPANETWTPPTDDWFWGELPRLRLLSPEGLQAVNVQLQPRAGPVWAPALTKIEAVVPQGHRSGRSFPKSAPNPALPPTPPESTNVPGTQKTPKSTSTQAGKTGPKKQAKPGGLPTPDATPKRSFTPSKPKTKEDIKKGTKKMRDKNKPRATPAPPPSTSSEEEPAFKSGNPDPTRRQASYSDGPGTLRMYFATTAQPIDDPTSRLLDCVENQLLLKVDHEDLAFPRMREVDLIEGYVNVENLQRIRRPWGIQSIMPTKAQPDFDSKRYNEMKLIAKKQGVLPGGSTRSVKRNILADKQEKYLEKVNGYEEVPIYKLRPSYRPQRQDFDPTLRNATCNCRYVLKTKDNGDETWVVTNIDGYSATIAAEMLIEEPLHWGISVPTGTTFPQAVNPDSPEPRYVPKKIDDTTDEDGAGVVVVEDKDDGGKGNDGDFDGGLQGQKPDKTEGDADPGFVIDYVPPVRKYDRSNVLSQCGIDGVTGALISLRNALEIINLEIRCMPRNADDTQAVAISATLERYIIEVNIWMAEMERRASRLMGAVPAGFPIPPTMDKSTQSSFAKFLHRLKGPASAVGAIAVACALLRSITKGASASTIASSGIVESDLRFGPVVKMGSTLGHHFAANSNPSPCRKRSFDETELEQREPLARRVKTKRWQGRTGNE